MTQSTLYHLIAHRGYSAIAPENTMASFQAALTESLWGVEFDVRLSAEGIPVIIHDPTVDRTTHGTGKVAESSIAQLQSLDAGSWFDPEFAGETIPSLEQAIALFSPTEIKLYVELKADCNWSATAIPNLLQILTSVRDRCIIASFDHNLLARIKEKASDLRVGYGISSQTQYCLEYLERVGEGRTILPHFSLILEQPFVTKALFEQGWDIATWTVDDCTIAEQIARLNVIKIISNNLLQKGDFRF